jgi:protein-tyrosine-phosphatase
MSAHRSALITPEGVRAAELIVVMAGEQASAVRSRFSISPGRVLVLGDLDPLPITRRTIADPWGGSHSDFEASYARIDRCVRELVRILRNG